MATLQLTIRPVHPEIIVGESLVVEITLANRGTAPIEVNSPESPSLFDFLLRSTKDNRSYTLSARRARLSREIEPGPALPRESVTIAPGASALYTDDLTSYMTVPVLPGEYQLSVLYDHGTDRVGSQPVPVSIVPPRVRAFATASGPNSDGLSTVFAHSERNGGFALFQRESHPGAPKDGIAYRQVDVQPPNTISGVASAVGIDGDDGVRWFSWLQGDSIGAGVAQGKTIFARVNPIPLGLNQARLAEKGWQPNTDTAFFVALGLDPTGHVSLAIANFRAAGTGAVKAVALAAARIPEHWIVQYQHQNDGFSFNVIWAEQAEGRVRVMRQSVAADSNTAGQPNVMVERPGRLLALSAAPFGGSGPGTADALFAPGEKQDQLALLRLGFNGGPPANSWNMPVPLDAGKHPATAWAIAPAPEPNPGVLAKAGDELMFTRASGSHAWSALMPNSAQADYLRLEVVENVLWAIWSDPANGIQYKFIQ